MNDEIKEILDILQNCKDYDDEVFLIKQHSATLLLDYITNLQQENQKLKEKLNCKEYFSSTMPEDTEFVILTKNNYDRQQKDIQLELIDYKSRVEKAVEQAKEKIKRYESYINDLKKGNYPSPTIRQERQELIFRIREQEDLLNILQNGSEDNVKD